MMNFEAVTSAFIIHTSDLPFGGVMNEIDDKIDYEPGTPELLSFLKALCFLFLVGLILAFGAYIGWSYGESESALPTSEYGDGIGVFTEYSGEAYTPEKPSITKYFTLSSFAGFIIAAYFGVPRLYRVFYR